MGVSARNHFQVPLRMRVAYSQDSGARLPGRSGAACSRMVGTGGRRCRKSGARQPPRARRFMRAVSNRARRSNSAALGSDSSHCNAPRESLSSAGLCWYSSRRGRSSRAEAPRLEGSGCAPGYRSGPDLTAEEPPASPCQQCARSDRGRRALTRAGRHGPARLCVGGDLARANTHGTLTCLIREIISAKLLPTVRLKITSASLTSGLSSSRPT